MASSKKTTVRKGETAPAKTAIGGRRKSAKTTPVEITSEERWRMIAVAAYHKAEKRGFAPGGETDDWLEAEREVDALLGNR